MKRPIWERDRSTAWWLLVAAFFLPCLTCFVGNPGFPYQDPTPEMSASYAADWARWVMGTAVAGAIAVALLIYAVWLYRRARRTEPKHSDEPTIDTTDTGPDAMA